MNAPLARQINGRKLADPQAVFAERCEARALLVINGVLSLHEAVDELQAYAELSGLIGRVSQDAVQEIMGRAFMVAEMLPADDAAACEREIVLRTADLVRQWELADPRDAWRVTEEALPTAAIRNSDISGAPADKPRPYRTPQSTIDAFLVRRPPR